MINIVNEHKQISQSQKRKNIFARNVASSAETVLNRLEESPNKPKNLDYFINTMREVFVHNRLNIHLHRRNNGKFIGYYCMMVPEEIIYAAGAIPLRLLGGSYDSSCAGEELVPRDTCPIAKSAVGSTLMHYPSVYEICDVIIVTTTCDSIRKMGEELSRFKEVWMLEVPHSKESEVSRKFWIEQVYDLKRNLEQYTGKKIGRRELNSSIEMIQKSQYQARRLYDLRKSTTPLIFGRDAALAINAFCFDTAEAWTEAMNALNNELEESLKSGRELSSEQFPRILLAGSPAVFPNWKIPSLVEEMGAVIVLDESCQGDRYLYDPVGISEKSMKDMIEGIAARYIMPCICPSFTPNDDRLYRLLQIAEDFKIDGILYHVLKGCIIYDFEIARIEGIMKERGIPVLRIETDYNPEDIEQLRTRIEAFIEVLKVKKMRRK